MSTLNPDLLQEGNGIYGWDLINPYLQEWYRKKENGENEESPAFIAPLPGENSVVPFPSIPKQETPIPLKPDYPINPEPEIPIETPRKLKSLTEGINLAGERIWNDLKYSRGYIQDKLSDSEMSEAAQKALERLPEYQRSTESQLQNKEDSLQNETEHSTSDRPRLELKGLEEYRRLRNENISPNEISRQLSETARWGNEGKKLMEEARMANNSFPETEGWATIGEIIANIGRVGIPVAAGAAFAPAGIAAGIANVASSVAESHAQAQMELDNFEQETGQRLTDGQRTGFVAICMGADLLFDTILQSRYLKNLKSGAKKKASEYFKKTILKNQTAQTEISKIMSKLSKTDKSALIAGTFNDAVTGGTAEALHSVAHDMAKTIYNEPGQYPTLESILQNATTGMVSGSLGGAAVGGTGRAINLKKRNMRRNKQTTTALVDQHGFAWEVLDYDPENKIAEVLSPNGKNTINVPDIEPDMIHSFSVGEYKNAGKIKREINEPDPFAPIIPDQTKDKVWQKMSTRGKYRLTKDLAERMGLDNVIVYEHESDLPVSVRSLKKQGGKIGGYYMHNGNIGIVLDNIPSYTRLQRVLLHEAIGHQGLDALFGDSYFKDEFLMKVYRSMPSEWKLRGNSWNARKTDAEEYLADLASNGVSSSAWNQIYGELRNMLRIFIPGLNFSEREIRNILIRSKNALKKDDSISEMNKKIRQRHLNESDDLGTPLTESDPETYRFLWENDPEWKNYKKFYDHVYGESTDIND